MRKYIPILVLFLMTTFLHPVLAQSNGDFDSVAKEQIKREVITILDSYEKYGTLTETFTYLSKDYTKEFRSLFAPNAMVLNDIGSPESREESLMIDEYMSVIQKWYPEGLAIEFKNFNKEKSIGNPYGYEDRFAVRVNVDKEINALTKEYNKVDTTVITTIVIVFDEDLTEFKIKEVNVQQSLNPEDVLAQVTKRKDRSAVQKTTKKQDKSIVQKSTKKEDKPIVQKSTKKEDKPIAQKSTKKEDKSIAQKPTKKEDKSIAQKPTKKEDKSIAQKPTKKEDKPSAKRTKKKSVKIKKRRPTLYKQVNRAEKGLFIGLSGGPYFSTTQFQLNDTWTTTFNINESSAKSPVSPHLRLEADYFLTENLGIGIGVGYNTYKSNIDIDSLSIVAFNVPEENVDAEEAANMLTFTGRDIREKPDYESINASMIAKYKKPIGNNLFLYGGVGFNFTFTSYRNFFRSAELLRLERTYNIEGHSPVTIHGLVPQNNAEAEFLEEYDLFDENSESDTGNREKDKEKNEAYSPKTTGNEFIFKKLILTGVANLGFAYSLDRRLKVKMGGVLMFGSNILSEKDLPSPNTELGLVEVLPDTGANVRNNYLSIANRAGNQLNIRAVGIEIGLMYKIGNIDLFR